MWINRKLWLELFGGWRSQVANEIEQVRGAHDRARADLIVEIDHLRRQLEETRGDLETREEAHDLTIHTLSNELHDLKVAAAKLGAERAELRRQLVISQNNFEWARLRLNQVEQERAILFDRALSVQFPAQQLMRETGAADVPVSDSRPVESGIPGMLNGLGLSASLFEDAGDEKAREMGYPAEEQGQQTS